VLISRDLSRQSPRSVQVAKAAQGILQILKAGARAYGINYEFETQITNVDSGDFLLKSFIRQDLVNYVSRLRGAAVTLFLDLDDR